jgi:hypothetical protein
MVFAFMAFGATGAHAEKGAKWLLADATGKLIPFLPASINIKKDKEITLVLHTEILKIKVLFLCLKAELLNAKLQEEGIIGNTVVTTGELKEGRGSRVDFLECKTHLNGVETPQCIPTDPVGGPGTIVTNPGHALLKLHPLAGLPSDDIVEVLPDTGLGTTFVTIPTGPAVGNECPIGTKVPVLGSLSLKDCENLALTHLVEHLVEPFTPLTELWAISKTEEHRATLLGSVLAFLEGAHVGLKWSGDPA